MLYAQHHKTFQTNIRKKKIKKSMRESNTKNAVQTMLNDFSLNFIFSFHLSHFIQIHNPTIKHPQSEMQ